MTPLLLIKEKNMNNILFYDSVVFFIYSAKKKRFLIFIFYRTLYKLGAVRYRTANTEHSICDG